MQYFIQIICMTRMIANRYNIKTTHNATMWMRGSSIDLSLHYTWCLRCNLYQCPNINLFFFCFCYHEINVNTLIFDMLLTSSPHQLSTARYHATSKQNVGNKSKFVVRGKAFPPFFCKIPSFFKFCCRCNVQCAF